MKSLRELETKYLKAKIAYYEGEPFMTDAEFDVLESELKKAGSKVHEQVGSKRKDFDFEHPTKMLSLSKIQTEVVNGEVDYKEEEFGKWYSKRKPSDKKNENIILTAAPKFDGSAINIIYKAGKLFQVITRGDGFYGKDITKRLTPYIPNEFERMNENDILEIRCEVVINKNLFEKKYKGDPSEEGKYANPRNYVAGVLGKDDYNEEKVSELTIMPLHYILNGNHVELPHKYAKEFETMEHVYDFEYKGTIADIIELFETLRPTMKYQLDGVVISFQPEERKRLGENDHDPEWAIAIKFVPDEVITKVNGIEWNVSKRGELTPVVLLKPIELAGTTVKRASGYNASFLHKNGVWIGAMVSIAKAGDIIPEIQNVVIPSEETITLPTNCPVCGAKLDYNDVHLICPNTKCEGKIAKILASSSGVLDLKGIGGERLRPFAKDFPNMYELMKWTLEKGETKDIEKYGIPFGTRMHEIFVQAFTNIKSLPYEKVIQILGYENVGKKISIQLAKEHAGLKPDYTGLEKALVAKLHEPDVEHYIKSAVAHLEALGVQIDKPDIPKEGEEKIGVVLTGSPKVFGYKTKEEFLTKFPNMIECSLSDKDCKFLITDDMNSTSGKMKNAQKKGITIKTYGDF